MIQNGRPIAIHLINKIVLLERHDKNYYGHITHTTTVYKDHKFIMTYGQYTKKFHKDFPTHWIRNKHGKYTRQYVGETRTSCGHIYALHEEYLRHTL